MSDEELDAILGSGGVAVIPTPNFRMIEDSDAVQAHPVIKRKERPGKGKSGAHLERFLAQKAKTSSHEDDDEIYDPQWSITVGDTLFPNLDKKERSVSREMIKAVASLPRDKKLLMGRTAKSAAASLTSTLAKVHDVLSPLCELNGLHLKC